MKRRRIVKIGMLVGGLTFAAACWQIDRHTIDVGRAEAQGIKMEWEEEETAVSQLKDMSHCWLCGSDNRSLMDYYRGQDDLGIICVNNWYVMGMDILGTQIEDTDSTQIHLTGTGEGGCYFHTENLPNRGIVRMDITYGEDSAFEKVKIQDHLCQNCLDKLMTVIQDCSAKEEAELPCELCLVDFKTLELYPLQKYDRSYFIWDYYIQINAGSEQMEILGIYAPERDGV